MDGKGRRKKRIKEKREKRNNKRVQKWMRVSKFSCIWYPFCVVSFSISLSFSDWSREGGGGGESRDKTGSSQPILSLVTL